MFRLHIKGWVFGKAPILGKIVYECMINETIYSMDLSGIKRRLQLSLVIFLVITTLSFTQEYIPGEGPLTMETVILSTDRSIYLPGEEMVLSATIVEADNYTISSLSRILRVEILNSSGTAMVAEKYETEGGKVNQFIKIPANLPSGWYQLRAYTSWMRNFRSVDFALLNFRVINPSEIDNIIVTGQSETLTASIIAPGNGNLITGIENNCGLKVTDMYGNPHRFEGALLNSFNDTLASVRTGSTGWGPLRFIPGAGDDYRFISTSGGSEVIQTRLPDISGSGYILNLLPGPGGTVNVHFRQKSNPANSSVRLLVHSLYNWYWYMTGEVKGGEVSFAVPGNTLAPSIMQFSILDEQGNLLAARLFEPPGMVAKGGEIIMQTSPDEPGSMGSARYITDERSTGGRYNIIIRRKEPVEKATLYIPGLPGWPGNNSIPLDQEEREGWLNANLYDSSTVKSFFSDPSGEPVVRKISFRDFANWKEQSVNFLPETRGFTINGSVSVMGTGEPVSGEILTLTTFSDNFLYTTTTFESGRFHFSLPGRFNDDDLILSYSRAPQPDWVLTLLNEFDTLASCLPPAEVTVTKEEIEYINDLSIDIQLDEIFSTTRESTLISTETSSKEKRMFFGYPDDVVYVDDFIRLPNMREVIFEVVPTVAARKEDDKWKIKVLNEQPFPKIYQPLIMLDGIPLLEFDEFLDLPPERIKRIEIINNLYIHGNVIFAGVVNFVSINSDLAGLNLPGESKILSMQAPLLTENIEVNTETDPGSGYPELSGQLRLLPMETMGSGIISFQASSNLGEYIMIISGFSETGKWSLVSKVFSIKGAYSGK